MWVSLKAPGEPRAMAQDPAELPRILAANLRALRELNGATQQQLADRVGLPRATWAHLEGGGANPTLAVLVKVAEALGVSLEELVAPPRARLQHLRAGELRHKKRGGVEVRELLPDPLPGLSLERMALPEGARMTGVPHTPGTREYLACETGSLCLSVSGEVITLEAGDVVVFPGDQRHAYHNPGPGPAVAYSAVLLRPESP